MTDVKITDLPSGGDFKNGDLLPVVRAGVTVGVERNQAGAAAAIDEANGLVTALTVTGQFEEVAATLALQAGSDYTVLGSKFTYTGTSDQQNTIVWWSFTVLVGAGGLTESFAFKVHLNGAPVPGRCVLEPDVDDSAAGSLIVVLNTITAGDEITLEVANLDGVKDITLTDQSVAILSD